MSQYSLKMNKQLYSLIEKAANYLNISKAQVCVMCLRYAYKENWSNDIISAESHYKGTIVFPFTVPEKYNFGSELNRAFIAARLLQFDFKAPVINLDEDVYFSKNEDDTLLSIYEQLFKYKELYGPLPKES